MTKIRLSLLFISFILSLFGYFYSDSWAKKLYLLPNEMRASVEGSYFIEVWVGQFLFFIGFIAIIINISSFILIKFRKNE